MSRKPKILMIDDEVMCELTRATLEESEYDLVALSDAGKARSAFSDDPHQFDLVILERVVSGVCGRELASLFLSLRPDIPVALYTGSVVSREEVRSKGFRDVIPKPLTKAELTRAIARIIAGAQASR